MNRWRKTTGEAKCASLFGSNDERKRVWRGKSAPDENAERRMVSSEYLSWESYTS